MRFSWLLACIAAFSAVCSFPQSKGAFEPWASNTNPSDVPKRDVQVITTAPLTYTIIQGGTLDRKMSTTLPGVWESYEQTLESSRSIRMENVGAAQVNLFLQGDFKNPGANTGW